MRFVVPLDYKKSIDVLRSNLVKEGLNAYVTVIPRPTEMEVKITKLGTSSIVFNVYEESGSTTFSLKKEKIAFTHKGYKNHIKFLIADGVKAIGGSLVP